MKVENLTQLKALIILLRKTGIEAIEIDGIKMTLGQPPKRSRKAIDEGRVFPEASLQVPSFTPLKTAPTAVKAFVEDVIKTDELSEEDLLFYSATGETN